MKSTIYHSLKPKDSQYLQPILPEQKLRQYKQNHYIVSPKRSMDQEASQTITSKMYYQELKPAISDRRNVSDTRRDCSTSPLPRGTPPLQAAV